MAGKPKLDNRTGPRELTYFPETREAIPLGKIIALRNKKLSYRAIAKLLGCTHTNIIERLQPYKMEIDNLAEDKKNKADVLAVQGNRLLNSLTTNDIKKMPGLAKVTAFAILNDKERLERGKSTENVSHAVTVQNVYRNIFGKGKEKSGAALPGPDDTTGSNDTNTPDNE